MKTLAIVTAIGLSRCAALDSPAALDSAQGKPGRVQFTDVTAAAGIKFTHNSGRLGRKWLPETLGSGARVLRRRRRRLAGHLPRQQQGLDAARGANR